MADPRLRVVIDAEDNASAELKKFEGNVGKSETSVFSFGKALGIAAAGVAAIAGAVTGAYYAMQPFIKASNELNNAMLGLNSVARAFKQDTDKAKQAAQDLAKDGLMSVKDAASGLKNLLASGFSLPESINLMNAFKDAAAFNRQGTLEFGQAIEGATQGIKNQNSIMVDNAGITKNLSVILSDAGYSAQDLGKVTSDVGVRTALYNGILKEASTFQGDAAVMAETLSGKQAALATSIFTLKAAIGDELKPVMEFFIGQMNNIVGVTGNFIQTVKEAGGIVEYFQNGFNSLMDWIEARTGLITILKQSFENVALVFNQHLRPELAKLWEALKPLMPFFQELAKVLGVLLVGAIIAFVKLVEVSLMAVIWGLTNAVKILNGAIELAKDLWNGFIDILAKVIEIIDRVIAKIKELNIIKGAQNFISDGLGFGGGKAAGGPVSGGTSYVVGENGPELFTPGSSGNIVPNHALGGNNVTVIVNGDISGADLIDKIKMALVKDPSLSMQIV